MKELDYSIEHVSMETTMKLMGAQNRYASILEDAFNVSIILKENHLHVKGEEDSLSHIKHLFDVLLPYLEDSETFDERDMLYVINLEKANQLTDFKNLNKKAIGRTTTGKPIYPKTIGQQIMCRTMEQNDIVFASGVAGTGKTYLAVVTAVTMLKKGEVERLILTRPAVEAGENLGFLPGDLKEKVDPYLRPLYDALYDTLGAETVDRYIDKGTIEIAPLAYMRGRTLDNAFIILDEAQNTTKSQMKMFLTRMGFESKVVITGDTSQIDLIRKRDSGLIEASRLLRDIPNIGFIHLTSLDVVRHPLVQKIIERYEEEEQRLDENSSN